ncbi:MAG: sel1 repeat family protein [Bacteroidetes bacterium]|nr:sel1 repeat family protein [Bacteroidota bacterium]
MYINTLTTYMVTLALSFMVYFEAIASTPPGGCNFEWGMPQNAPLRNRNRPGNVLALPGAVFKVQYDKRNCGCGWPTVDVGAIGVKNGYPATSVTVKLKGYSCDGTANVASYYAHNVGPGQWDGGSGNTHTLKDANFITVLRVEIEYYDTEFGATYRYVTDYETGLDETYINNRPWREIEREAEEKKQEEEKARRDADEAQRRQQQEERQRQQQQAQEREQARQEQAAQERREEQQRQREEAAQRQALRDQILQQQQQLQQQTNQEIQGNIDQMADALTQGINSIMAEEQRKEDARAEQQRQQAAEAEEREAASQQAQQQAASDNSADNASQTSYGSRPDIAAQGTAEQIATLTDQGMGQYAKGDYIAAAGYLRQAYDLGDRCRAAYFVGWCYLQMNQGQQGIDYLATVTCQQDGYDINAATNIGAIYHYGQHGVQKDDARALVYLQKATALGGVAAQVMAGDIYRSGGPNVPKDIDKALVQYNAAAGAGARQAMNALGEICLERKDYTGALDWFKKGSDIHYSLKDIQHTYLLPYPEAIRHYGEIYENGWGVTRDLSVAYFQYADAAQYVRWAANGVVAFDDKGEVMGGSTISYGDLEGRLQQDMDRVFPKLTAVKAADIAGTWSYQLFWPSSALSGVNGKVTFTAGEGGSVTGSLVSDPGQRLTMNSTLACDGISKICLNGTVQSPGSDITQLYNLFILNSKTIVGIVQNIVPPGSGRPPYWDIPGYIVISR